MLAEPATGGSKTPNLILKPLTRPRRFLGNRLIRKPTIGLGEKRRVVIVARHARAPPPREWPEIARQEQRDVGQGSGDNFLQPSMPGFLEGPMRAGISADGHARDGAPHG